MNDNYIGVIEDPRSEEKKSQDFKYDGLIASATPVVWEEKDIIKSYLIKNQDGSSSCVAQATSKLLGIHEVVEGREYKNLSPKFIYTRRSNYPDGGMWFQNALEIAVKSGSCLEESLPSDMKGESFMNDKSQEVASCAVEALEYKAKNYIALPIDIDKIAEVIEQGYGVLLGFRFDYNEWTTYPFLDPNSKLACHHGVPGIDKLLIKGVKHLSIDDSWGPGYGKGGVRYISEEFLNARCTYAGYITSLVYEPQDEEFHYQWVRSMRFYGVHNVKKDVMALQKALQVRGYFPKIGKIDGIFGAITLKAVKDFQRSYALKADGIVGPKTLLVLNTQFK
jgi:hypothetical protein